MGCSLPRQLLHLAAQSVFPPCEARKFQGTAAEGAKLCDRPGGQLEEPEPGHCASEGLGLGTSIAESGAAPFCHSRWMRRCSIEACVAIHNQATRECTASELAATAARIPVSQLRRVRFQVFTLFLFRVYSSLWSAS